MAGAGQAGAGMFGTTLHAMKEEEEGPPRPADGYLKAIGSGHAIDIIIGE